MSRKALQRILGDQVVAYRAILAKISGGAAEGVLLSQLLYWDSKMGAARGSNWDGWFYKAAHEIYDETGMTRREFETARANLLRRGFIEMDIRGVPRKAHYRILLDTLVAALEAPEEFAKQHNLTIRPKSDEIEDEAEAEPQDVAPPVVQNEHVQNGQDHIEQASLSKMDKPVRSEWTNKPAQNGQTIHKTTSGDSQKNSRTGGAPASSVGEGPEIHNWTADKLWSETTEELRLQMTKATYDSWVRPAAASSFDPESGTLVIAAHTPSAKQWMENRLYGMIERALLVVSGAPVQVRFEVAERNNS